MVQQNNYYQEVHTVRYVKDVSCVVLLRPYLLESTCFYLPPKKERVIKTVRQNYYYQEVHAVLYVKDFSCFVLFSSLCYYVVKEI